MIPDLVDCAVVSDDIRAHVANLSAIETNISFLSRGLMYMREFSEALPHDSRANTLHDLSGKALDLLAQVRRDLRYFGSRPPPGELPEDPEMLKRDLRESRPHAAVEGKLENATTHTLPLCGTIVTSLEYVIQFYQKDLDSFQPSPSEKWYQNIERASSKRIATAHATIEALQEIIRNSIETSR